MEEARIPMEYILFPNEGHGWRKTQNRVTFTVSMVQFFAKYLKPTGSGPEIAAR